MALYIVKRLFRHLPSFLSLFPGQEIVVSSSPRIVSFMLLEIPASSGSENHDHEHSDLQDEKVEWTPSKNSLGKATTTHPNNESADS